MLKNGRDKVKTKKIELNSFVDVVTCTANPNDRKNCVIFVQFSLHLLTFTNNHTSLQRYLAVAVAIWGYQIQIATTVEYFNFDLGRKFTSFIEDFL